MLWLIPVDTHARRKGMLSIHIDDSRTAIVTVSAARAVENDRREYRKYRKLVDKPHGDAGTSEGVSTRRITGHGTVRQSVLASLRSSAAGGNP
jgi:hypothetical protein